MKTLIRFTIAAAALLRAVSPASGAAITLTLPSSSISGPAGSTVGWGYTITNPNADWLETLNLSAGIFTHGTPASIFDFPVIAPFSTVTRTFSSTVTGACPSPDCGLFEFTWDAGAAPGSSNSGIFTVSSEFFATNPLTDPAAVDDGPASDATASYTVSVSGPAVPEPSTFQLLIAGACCALWGGWRRYKSA